jgi:hypothetical protein
MLNEAGKMLRCIDSGKDVVDGPDNFEILTTYEEQSHSKLTAGRTNFSNEPDRIRETTIS